MLTTKIEKTREKGMYLWIAHLRNPKQTDFGGYIMNIDFCRKTEGVKPIIFKELHTLRAAKNKVKSHTIFTTTALRRQMIVQYENIIKCSESKFRNYIFNVFTFKQAILNST